MDCGRNMRSLPVVDRDTNRVESIAFACLGLVSLVLITIAVLNGGKFAAGQDDIVASLKNHSLPVVGGNNWSPLPATAGNTAARSALAAPQE
jgi:hypothetical protein